MAKNGRRTSTRIAEDPGAPLGGGRHHLKRHLLQIKATKNFLFRLQPCEEGRETMISSQKVGKAMTCTLPHTWECCTPLICLHPALGVSSGDNSGLQETSTHSGNSIHNSATPEAAAYPLSRKKQLMLGPSPAPRARETGQGCDHEEGSGLRILHHQCLPFPVPLSDWRTWLPSQCAEQSLTDQGENDAILTWEHLIMKQVRWWVFCWAQMHKTPNPFTEGRASYHHVLWIPETWGMTAIPVGIYHLFKLQQSSDLSGKRQSCVVYPCSK